MKACHQNLTFNVYGDTDVASQIDGINWPLLPQLLFICVAAWHVSQNNVCRRCSVYTDSTLCEHKVRAHVMMPADVETKKQKPPCGQDLG